MPSKNDLEFGKIAIQSKYVTETRVRECLAEQKKVEKSGKTTSLDHILFQRGLLTPKQLTELQNKQGRRIIFCDDCHAKLNVFDFEPGSKVKCPKCSMSMPVPEGAPERPDATKASEPFEEKPAGLAGLLDGVDAKKGPVTKKPASVAKKPAPPARSTKPAPPKKGLLDEDLELIEEDDHPTVEARPEKKEAVKGGVFDDDDLELLPDDEELKNETLKATKEKLPPPKPRDPALADTAHNVPSAKKPIKPPSRLGTPKLRRDKK